MAGKLVFTLEQYKEAATKYRKELLMLTILGLDRMLPYVQQRPGIRHKEAVGSISYDAEFGPYSATRSENNNLNLEFRILETFFGSVVSKFEPNSAISTLLGLGLTKGDAQKNTPTAKMVLASIVKSLSKGLYNSIWSAVRKSDGTKSKDLFNGYDTITKNEITSGGISLEKKNLIKISEEITIANAVDIAKEIIFAQDDILRESDTFLFCTRDFADKYNEAYSVTHTGLNYNTKYNQVFVEGSENRCTLVPLANKAGSNYFHVTTKDNMLLGYDQLGDLENIEVERFEPFVLSFIATMFFGVEFESIDPRRLLVAEIGNPAA